VSGRELWFIGPHEVELRRGVAASLVDGQVRARALASGVSQGTELLLFRGDGPTPFDPSLDPPGAPTYPRRYGYAWVGEVVESNSGSHPRGAHVFALAPHGDEHVLNAGDARVLPAWLPPARAVLAANLETAVNVVWDAQVALGDDVLVVGGGVVGLLVGHLAQKSGAGRVRLLEPSARRREAALALGFDEVSASAPPGSPVADVVVEASGDPACLDLALRLVRDEGVVTVASFYGQRTAPVALGTDFHRRRLSLRSSQVSRIPPSHSAGWSFGRRFDLVTNLLKNPQLDALLDGAVPFDEAPATYARLARAPGEALQTVFSYPS
jgi:2-desacetyl-2-hydroxyethyl bacteriochlorophyllide A dehydrogenase